jgi:prepilin-type N-terminal cleavage/methylation domain-containing protein
MAIGMEYKVYLSKSWSRINLIKRFLIMGQKISQRGQRKGFTLVELLVVLALISILAVILLVAIRPFEIFKKARDAQRIADLNRIDQIITVIYTQDFSFSELNYASPNVVYISLKDSSATCTSWLSQLPSLPSGWSYRCSATPTSMNGDGWIPIRFSDYPIIALSQLPIDPINQPPYYYSFVVGGSYELTAALEANKGPDAIGGKDGGDHNFVYEAGTNKKLTPSSVQARAEPDSLKQGLVGWWTFDEGTGTTTKDLSGNGNDGILCNISTCGIQGPTWTTGKVGGSLRFDGVDDWVITANSINLANKDFTLIVWAKTIAQKPSGDYIIFKHGYFAVACGTLNFVIRNDKPHYGLDYSGCYFTDSTYIKAGEWYHFAFVNNNSNSVTDKIFINGALSSQAVLNPYAGATSQLRIGGEGSFYLSINGLIDEVRLYNRALSDSEIKALYDATK